MRQTPDSSRRVLLAAAVAPLLSWSAQAYGAPPAGYQLVWSDEFNQKSWSSDQIKYSTRWTDHIWYGGGNGPHDIPRAQNLAIQKGALVLTANKASGGNYYGGTLSSVNSNAQGFYRKYGYWETRMKPAAGYNLLTSLYMISQPHMAKPSTPADPFEIDAIEYNDAGGSDNYVANTVHWYSGGKHYDNEPNNKTKAGVNLSKDYHTYGMEWTPTVIRFFVDGEQTKQVATPPDGHVPAAMMVVLYLTGGGASKTTPASAQAYVDYVRVYALPS